VTATAGTCALRRVLPGPGGSEEFGHGRPHCARSNGRREDRTSDNAFLALIEIAEAVCLTSKPACNLCHSGSIAGPRSDSKA